MISALSAHAWLRRELHVSKNKDHMEDDYQSIGILIVYFELRQRGIRARQEFIDLNILHQIKQRRVQTALAANSD